MAATAAVYNRLHNASFGNGIGAVGGGSGTVSNAANALHSQLARSLERILEEAHLSGELILANRKLKDFPKTGTKYNLADTVIADLSRNRFCELPEEITNFPFLETLLLYHNTIRTIPESIKNLTSLTYLDLRSNQLPSLPREVCFLPLQVLLVSNNRLTALPDELGRMDRLTDLDASYNQLTALPARIGELRSLRSFSLRSNQLMYLPRELTCLTLVSLDVSNNRIASLPLEIRQMSTLVEFNLENNPLTSPPASLCVRGLVHVFKYLETQAIKDEKGSRAGGNYDGYTTLRRAPRHNSSGNVLDTHRIGRPHIDSGYSTCDSIDKRWSQDMPIVKNKNAGSPIRRLPITPPNSLSAEIMDASLTSSSSTIVDESISLTAAVVKPLNVEPRPDLSPEKQNPETLPIESQPLPQSPTKLNQHIAYSQSSSSNGSSPDHEDDLMIDSQQQNGKLSSDEKLHKNLDNIQTYREFKAALRQQRNQEVNVYKIKGQQKTLYDMNDATNALNSNTTPLTTGNNQQDDDVRINNMNIVNNILLPKSIMKNTSTTNGHNVNGNGALNGLDETISMPKKPIQKVIPSRNTELMSQATKVLNQNQENEKFNSPSHTNGDCLGYVKPNSPMKTINGSVNVNSGILINNNKVNTNGSSGLKSPVNGSSLKLSTSKTNRTVTWNHDIPAEKLSFTMRREFDRQREETELMTQLRSIIETRLKMTLPEDIASALTDGVILCHLANYVRPRSVASIHVPSPGVSKLTMARCRRNVDNFLEACRRIGVDEELICSCADIVPAIDDTDRDNDDHNEDKEGGNTQSNDLYFIGNNNNEHFDDNSKQNGFKSNKNKIPNPEAVFKTVTALIEMDSNPHHQTAKFLYQQQMQQQQLEKIKLKPTLNENFQQFSSQSNSDNDHNGYMKHDKYKDQEGEHEDQHQQENDQQYQQHQQQYLNYNSKNYDEDLQQTATCTKQQIQQQQQHNSSSCKNSQETSHRNHQLIANYEFKASKANCLATCHVEDILTNGNNQTRISNDRDKEHFNYENVYISKCKTVGVAAAIAVDENDADVVGSFDTLTKKLIKHKQMHNYNQEHQQEHEQNCANTLLQRSANLKNFQKIKFNNNSSNASNNNFNNPSINTKALQTILETENDGDSSFQRTSPDGHDFDNAYELVNEKLKKSSTELSLKISPKSCNDLMWAATANKYKLLELSALSGETANTLDVLDSRKESEENSSTANHKSPGSEALVSKRIEFFEHSTNGNNSISCGIGACNSLVSPLNGPTTKSSSPTNVLTPNGIVASAKSKVMNNIFSIYQVNNIPSEKFLPNGKLQAAAMSATNTNSISTSAMEKDVKDAGSSLLRHDSYILTIILSCIFIGTFLLLIFFPLPG